MSSEDKVQQTSNDGPGKLPVPRKGSLKPDSAPMEANLMTSAAPDPDGSSRTGPLTTFYNGACPICGAEIRHYKRISREQDLGLIWCDISRDRFILSRLGLEHDDVKRRLHVIDGDGRIHVGVDAFVALWSAMPRYNWLARLLRRPTIYRAAAWLYDRVLAPLLLAWNKRRERRLAANLARQS